MNACYCMGPQNGEPLCPCRMNSVTIMHGRYVRIEDLGPVQNPAESPINIFKEINIFGSNDDDSE